MLDRLQNVDADLQDQRVLGRLIHVDQAFNQFRPKRVPAPFMDRLRIRNVIKFWRKSVLFQDLAIIQQNSLRVFDVPDEGQKSGPKLFQRLKIRHGNMTFGHRDPHEPVVLFAVLVDRFLVN